MVFTAYEEGTSGKPALPRRWRRGGEYVSEKKEKIGVQRHIRIADSELNAQIERLMQQPGYESANKVINDALYYGLPILTERIFGGAVTEEERLALSRPRESGSREEEFYAVATRLLKETALNAAINKSILSSIYNFIYDTLNPYSKEAKNLNSGLMSDTPEYLERFEAEGLRSSRK